MENVVYFDKCFSYNGWLNYSRGEEVDGGRGVHIVNKIYSLMYVWNLKVTGNFYKLLIFKYFFQNLIAILNPVEGTGFAKPVMTLVLFVSASSGTKDYIVKPPVSI